MTGTYKATKMFESTAFYLTFLAIILGSGAQLNMTEMCPYNTFCTSGPLKSWTQDEHETPCCEHCLCTEDCELFGKCCYDYEPKRDIEQTHKCYTQDQLYNDPRNIFTGGVDGGFVFITSCPGDDQGYESCLEMQNFDDFIPVSRNTDGRIYVNRKCALCNGDEDVIEWTLNILDCPDIISNTFNSTDHFVKTVLESCKLYSMPPISLYNHVLKYECAGTRAVLNMCGQFGDINEEVITENEIKCKLDKKLPYIIQRKHVYKNAYCLHCFRSAVNVEYMCVDTNLVGKSDGQAFMMILNTKNERNDAPRCGKEEMFDPLQKACIQLYCPTFYLPGFGVCHAFAGSALNFVMHLVFSAETNGEIVDSDQLGLNLVRFFKNNLPFNLVKNENLQRCNLVSLALLKFNYSPNTVVIHIKMMTTELCTIYDVLRDVKYFTKWVASKRFDFQSSDTSISNITMLRTFSLFAAEYIYMKAVYIGGLGSFFVTPEVLEECPSVEIDVRQHPLKNEIEESVQKSKLQGDESMVKICVEDYLALISNAGHHLLSKSILFIIFLFTKNNVFI